MSLNLEFNLGQSAHPLTPSGDLDLSSRVLVPNQQPTFHDVPYKLAIVGEAPGQEEETHGQPFIGASGHVLNNLLANCNILRSACLVANICQVKPPGGDASRLSWNSAEIQNGLKQLKLDLDAFRPNLVLLLGNTALRAARGEGYKVSDWRGSLFQCHYPGSPLDGYKCLGSIHPAAILRTYEDLPLLNFDLKRARREAEFPDLRLPQRKLELDLTADEICHRLDNWPAGVKFSYDIEGGLDGQPCSSVSDDPSRAFIIAWTSHKLEDEMRIRRSLSRAFYRQDIPKVLQNSLYDNFVLSYGFHTTIRNVAEDTMLKGWEIYSELPKGLGTQASIYTREPYYKFERKADDQRKFWEYCCKDSAVTLEICNAQSTILDGPRLDHYRLNVRLLEPLLFMQLRGIAYDKQKAADRLAVVQNKMLELNTVLAAQAGRQLNINSPKQLCEYFYRIKGFAPIFKKEHGRNTDRLTTDVEALLTLHKKYNDPSVATVLALRRLDSARETLEVTTDSDGRVRCGYNIVGTETGRLTCYGSPTGSGANLQTITEEQRDIYIADPGHHFFQCDLNGADGWTVAVRCKLLGDSTMYDDYMAGIKPAKVIALMYETLQSALSLHKAKKAFEIDAIKNQILVGFAKMDRARLAEECKKVGKGGLYFICKMIQHGSNYGMGKNTTSSNVLKQSYKKLDAPIYFSPSDCGLLQELYLNGRYRGVHLWHKWVENELLTRGYLWAASGQKRMFFGRKKTAGKTDVETFKAALSHEPQANTTYATNLAMYKLWNDPENKIARRVGPTITTSTGRVFVLQDERNHQRLQPGALIIEPLHTVHDALCGQFPIELTEWARPKVKSYFDNPITIDSFQFVIPFEGRYGKSWGELDFEL